MTAPTAAVISWCIGDHFDLVVTQARWLAHLGDHAYTFAIVRQSPLQRRAPPARLRLLVAVAMGEAQGEERRQLHRRVREDAGAGGEAQRRPRRHLRPHPPRRDPRRFRPALHQLRRLGGKLHRDRRARRRPVRDHHLDEERRSRRHADEEEAEETAREPVGERPRKWPEFAHGSGPATPWGGHVAFICAAAWNPSPKKAARRIAQGTLAAVALGMASPIDPTPALPTAADVEAVVAVSFATRSRAASGRRATAIAPSAARARRGLCKQRRGARRRRARHPRLGPRHPGRALGPARGGGGPGSAARGGPAGLAADAGATAKCAVARRPGLPPCRPCPQK